MRLRQLLAPAQIAPRQSFGAKNFGSSRFDDRARRDARPAFGSDESYVAASPHFAVSPLHRGHRAAIPRREALILQAALNHPWLLHDHLEELAEAEFRHADTQKLKGALIDVFAHHSADEAGQRTEHGVDNVGDNPGEAERTALAAALTRRGFGDLLARIERTITTPSVWGARPEAAAADVLLTWKQLVALHRQWHSLTRELKDAETALGQDNSEANYARLRDVKARLASLDGTEALIEGFGASSGRAAKSL